MFFLSNIDSTLKLKKISKGTNVYAFARARRTDGTESVVISAPIFISGKNGEQIANSGGLAELIFLANIAKCLYICFFY